MATVTLNAATVPEPASVSSVSASLAFNFDWRQVEQGLPLATLDEFAAYSGFVMKNLLEVVIPLRTLKHRRQRQEPLSPEESDRLARVARLWELGKKVFGDPDKARRWLTKPKVRFEERTPLLMMRTGVGTDAVEEMLIQIDEGYFA
jgi:putative toxin-antitoxin system antitoxin component (TIGR02293 family)